LFISLVNQDVQMARDILLLFHGASGLGCNFGKCQMPPKRCDNNQIALAASLFP
jgi:hypothetical protein